MEGTQELQPEGWQKADYEDWQLLWLRFFSWEIHLVSSLHFLQSKRVNSRF